MSKFINTITAVSLACGLTFGASAQNNREFIVNEQGDRTIFVTYDDLNMATPAGQEALSNRIQSAVSKVCGATTARQTLAEMQEYRACTSKAWQGAMASLDKDTKTLLAINR